MELITHIALVVVFGYSLAVLLVEKGDDWPVTFITTPLRWLSSKISQKFTQVFYCTVCMSFWTTLFGELVSYFYITKHFMWPFTGIIALGFTWTLINFMNAIDNTTNK